MEGRMSDMSTLSDALLEIHALPEKVNFARFQDEALKRVKMVVEFDAAWWGLVAGFDIHSAARFGLPEGYRRTWEHSVRDQDPIAAAALAKPFKTVIFNQDRLQDHELITRFLSSYGIQHVLCTTTRQPNLGLYAFLSLYRSEAPFSERDRDLKQAITPHLMQALGQSWRDNLQNSLGSLDGQPSCRAAAVCDFGGLILSSEARFDDVLRREWPTWKGPRIPQHIAELLDRTTEYAGRHLQMKIDRVEDHYLLRASELNPITTLTNRESEVAQLFGSGKSYKEVAMQLGLAPTTARHYLRNVYSKLQVSDKAALARLLAQSE